MTAYHDLFHSSRLVMLVVSNVFFFLIYFWSKYNSQVALAVKNPPASAGDARDMGSIPEVGRSQEEEMATCSSILAWEITWTEEPGGLQSTGSQRVGHDWAHTHAHTYLFNSVVLVSAVQQCEPAIRRHITPPSWASFLPTPPSRHPTPLGCHRAANWVSCVMQQLPTS